MRPYVSVDVVRTPAHFQALHRKVATLFRRVFGQPPWNEGYYCPECDALFALEPAPTPCCQEALRPCFPEDYALEIVQRPFDDPRGVLSVATDADDVVGFNWSRVAQADELALSICGQETSTAPEQLTALKRAFGGAIPDACVILQETVVAPTHRGMRLSDKLVAASLADLTCDGSVQGAIMKTQAGSAMHHLRLALGFEEIWRGSQEAGAMVLLSASVDTLQQIIATR